jgi:hypothetical protein
MEPYLPQLMSLIVDALQDGASESKREIAVAALGHVVESTGYDSKVNKQSFLIALAWRDMARMGCSSVNVNGFLT